LKVTFGKHEIDLDKIEPKDYVKGVDSNSLYGRIPILYKDGRKRVHRIFGTRITDGKIQLIGNVWTFADTS
jgi:hypothetical protein